MAIMSMLMSDAWKTQHTLLQRAKDPSDQEAWNEFVAFYEEFIRMILLQMQYQPADFDDAVQDVLFKIWKSLPDFNFDPKKARFRTWLSKLIRNKVIDRIRSSKTYAQHISKFEEEKTQAEEALIEQSELDQLIDLEWQRYLTKKAFENIEPMFSGVAIRVFEYSMTEMSSKEISEKLCITPDSVRVLKNRVQKRLVEEIQHLRSELEL